MYGLSCSRKSEYFRELLLDDFHVFLELTVESNHEKLLPPPVAAAKKLKQEVLQAVHKWHSTFKESHKRLALSYNFLKHNLKVDFDDALKRNAFELQKESQEKERQSKVVGKKVDGVKKEMEDKVDEISRIITEMNNCFGLLVPKPDELFQDGPGKGEDEEESEPVNLREHGIMDPRTVISISLPEKPQQIKITEDNSVIVESLKDHYNELKNGYLPVIKKWVQVVSKADDSTLFKRIMDMKGLVEEEMKRFEGLLLIDRLAAPDSSDESDSDFEEVPDKDDYEEFAVEPIAEPPLPSIVTDASKRATVSEDLKWRPWNEKEEDPKDPATLAASLARLRAQQATTSSNAVSDFHDQRPGTSKQLSAEESRKQKLLRTAPKLPYDVDLYHWEDEKLVAPSIEM